MVEIKGHYPIEIHRYLEHEMKEQAKPQPNLDIDNFLIKQYLKIDKLFDEHEAKHRANMDNYNAKMKELEDIRATTEKMRSLSENPIQSDKPVLNPQKVKTMGFFNTAMDLFFSKRKE